MKIKLLSLILFYSIQNLAQKHDNIWLFGYDNFTSAGFGGSIIDFTTTPLIYEEQRFMDFSRTNSSICNKTGDLQFYTNGTAVGSFENELMENGNDLNPSIYTDQHQSFGFLIAQTAIALPVPENENLYTLFHLSIEYPEPDLSWHAPYLYRTTIDMEINNGSGLVLEKNIPIIIDTLATGGLTATKHANGRDWWLIMPEFNTSRYYKILHTNNETIINDVQEIGDTVFNSVTQTTFSPDGSKYIRAVQNGGTDHINIYDFDRCTGELGSHIDFKLSNIDNGTGIGMIVSPNSRYLYISQFDQLWQYDLWSEDIEVSQLLIAEWDGFEDLVFPTSFSNGLLAPNHKIYIGTSHATRYLHVIDRPNEYGAACRFLQHEIMLPTWNLADCMPNYPHFRLGPIDGSSCDTLDIDNHPVAAWVHDLETLTVKFTDYSYYEPTEWFWDFGDMQTSSEQQPIHEYAEEGVYEICLTVSNEFDSDTLCKMVAVIISGVEDLGFGKGITVFPNPSNGAIQLKMEKALPENGRFVLYDNLGKVVFEKEILKGLQSEIFDFQHFSKGIYFYEIRRQDLKIGVGKMVFVN